MLCTNIILVHTPHAYTSLLGVCYVKFTNITVAHNIYTLGLAWIREAGICSELCTNFHFIFVFNAGKTHKILRAAAERRRITEYSGKTAAWTVIAVEAMSPSANHEIKLTWLGQNYVRLYVFILNLRTHI